MVIVVDDAQGTNAAQVTDEDLRQLVNGAWEAGAEGIAINGHRLTTRTAIRSAGSAITVDYRSLLRPYRVEAIGDPKTLPARFANTPGGPGGRTPRTTTVLRTTCRRPRRSRSRPILGSPSPRPRSPEEDAMFAILALLIGIALGIWLEPSLPTGLTTYLPIMIVAALDALFGAI
jgi:hypothetical protein